MKRSKQAARNTRRQERAGTAALAMSSYARKKAARNARQEAPSGKLKPQYASKFWDRIEAEGGRPSLNKQAGLVDIYFLRNVARVIVAAAIISIFINMARIF